MVDVAWLRQLPELRRISAAGLRELAARGVERLDRWSFLGVRGRLARHLLELDAGAAGGPFALGMSQQELAEELGTVREVLARELRALQRRRIIRASGKAQVAVLDRPALQQLCAE